MTVERARVQLMGTVIELQVESDEPRTMLEEAIRRLRVYEHRFSANDPTSELGELNSAAGVRAVKVHPQLLELISLGKLHSCAPGSMLNIAIGPLVQLWRIGFTDAAVPERAEVQRALALTDPMQIDVDLESERVFLRRRGMMIDLGALAKGYIADLIIQFFRESGARSALVNLGGNVMVLGSAPGRSDGSWRAGLRHPMHPQHQLVGSVALRNESMVTSGVYQRKLVREGRTFHHLLDPHTGMPIETDVVSLTVVTPRSVDGEIWTSRLFGQPVEAVLVSIGEIPGADAIVITEDLRLYSTARLRDRIELAGE